MGHWTLARREQHINRCCDAAAKKTARRGSRAASTRQSTLRGAARDLVCFMCDKGLGKMARRSQDTHLKTCAQQRGVSTAELIAWRRSVDNAAAASGAPQPKSKPPRRRHKAGGGSGGGGGGASARQLAEVNGTAALQRRIDQLDAEIASRQRLRAELVDALALKARQAHDEAIAARNVPLPPAVAIAYAFSPSASPQSEAEAEAERRGGSEGKREGESEGEGVVDGARGLSRAECALSAWAMAGAHDVLDGVALSQTKFVTKFTDGGVGCDASASSVSEEEEEGESSGDEAAAEVAAEAGLAAAALADAEASASESSGEDRLDDLVDALTQASQPRPEEQHQEVAVSGESSSSGSEDFG